MNRVILPVMSNILQALETNSLLVRYDGIMLMVVVGFRPLFLLAKFISLTSSQITSSFGTISFLQHLYFHHHQTMILMDLDLKK